MSYETKNNGLRLVSNAEECFSVAPRAKANEGAQFKMQLSNNSSAHLNRSYVFLPVDVRIKLSIYSFVGIYAFYAVLANGLILYFKRKQNLQRKSNQRRRAFDRFVVTSTFVQSLAISDFLCAVVSVPLVISSNLFDIIDTDFKCKTVRFINIFFPVVTINNLFVIGIERYLAVFHPFRVPSHRIVKALVVCAWVLGGLITLIPAYTYRLQRLDIDADRYTVLCVYDKSTAINKAMFLGFTVFIYVLPAIILSFTNIRILLRLKSKKLKNSVRCNSWRFYGTSVFVVLIFSFVIPYFLFVGFSGLNMLMKLRLSFDADYVIRRIGGVLAYSNSAISPTVMLLSMPDLKRMSRDYFRKYFSRKSNAVMDGSIIGNRNAHLVAPSTTLPLAGVLAKESSSINPRWSIYTDSPYNGVEMTSEECSPNVLVQGGRPSVDVQQAYNLDFLDNDAVVAFSDMEN